MRRAATGYYQVLIDGELGDRVKTVVEYDRFYGETQGFLEPDTIIDVFLRYIPDGEEIPEFSTFGILLALSILTIYILRRRS